MTGWQMFGVALILLPLVGFLWVFLAELADSVWLGLAAAVVITLGLACVVAGVAFMEGDLP